jgi:hypothetical protein
MVCRRVREVIDPGGGLCGVMDIAICGGKIAEVVPSLRETDARRTISANAFPCRQGKNVFDAPNSVLSMSKISYTSAR